MVRFSQTLGDKQLKNKVKPYEQVMENPNYYSQEKQPYVINTPETDRLYSQPSRPIYQEENIVRPPQREEPSRPVYREDNIVRPPQREEPSEIVYERPVIERESVQPDYSKPELKFPADQNIQFGVEYSPNSRPPVIGKNHTIRSNSIIYNDVVIGDNFRTGHNVVIRENTNIGDDVLIGTNTVIEGDVIIGNDVSIQSNVYIPTNSVIEDNVFIGPCACFTNDKYPVRINYELQGPRVRRGASIGGNTTFLSNVEIGEGSIVAAGAIVIHSVPPFYLAIGTPARIKPLPDHLKVPNRF